MSRGRLATFVAWAWDHWATRSLAVGGVATVLDVAFGTTLLVMGLQTRWAAMSGVVLGAAFTFVANRTFAFREKNPKVTSQAMRFLLVTALASVVHGQVVVWLRDGLGVPFVPSKLAADIAIFTFGQLLLFRYIVFPRAKVAPTADAPGPGEASPSPPAADLVPRARQPQGTGR